MKKLNYILVLTLAPFLSFAQYYYETYPITVSLTNNGTQERLELSCYDSTLATTMVYNTPYHDSYTYSNNNGFISFIGSDCGTTSSEEAGFIIYDYLLHQYRVYGGVYDCDRSVSVSGGALSFSISYYTNSFQDYEYEAKGYYDLMHHTFVTEGQRSHEQYMSPIVSFNGFTLYTNCMHMIEPEEDYYIRNPYGGVFSYLGGAISQPGSSGSNGVAGLDYFESGFWGSSGDDISINTFHPEGGGGFSFDDAEYAGGNGFYVVKDKITDVFYLYCYDATLRKWAIDSFPAGYISNYAIGQRVIGLTNNTSTKVYGAVYNYDLHQWIIDSVSTTSTLSFSVSEGTIMWASSTNDTLGYNPVTGWGKYLTTLTPMFHISDLSDTSSGNLVFVKDYSIGATGFSVNYGDGTIGPTNNWHLYKVAGSYLYQGPLQDTICYTVSNSHGSATSCKKISCLFSLAKITSPSNYFCQGDSVRIVANSTPGLTYQWFLNGAPVSNASDSSYYAKTSGTYLCLISDSCNAQYSNTLTIQMHAPIINASIISNISLPVCSNISSFSLTASPSGAGYTYQWFLNGALLSSQNNILHVNQLVNNDSYECVIANQCNIDTSAVFVLTVQQLSHTAGITATANSGCVGDSILLQANPPSGSGFGYQWKKASSNIIGATQDHFYAKQTGSYSCIVFDSVCSANSPAVYLNFTAKPTANIVPAGPTSFCSPDSVLLTANNLFGASYQWFKNGILLSGSTQRNFVASHRGNYTVKVSRNNCDSVSLPIIVNVPCVHTGGGGINPISRISSNSPIALYPNPAKDIVFIEDSEKVLPDNFSIKVIDALGRTVIQKTHTKNSDQLIFSVPVVELPPGLYVLCIEDTKHTYRFFKQE